MQNDLFDVGADLSVPFAENDGNFGSRRLRSTRSSATRPATTRPSELKSFVLPGGSEAAARLHVARAVCRRAELVALGAADERPVNPLALVYLNRLRTALHPRPRRERRGRRAALEAGRLADRPDLVR